MILEIADQEKLEFINSSMLTRIGFETIGGY